MVSAFMFGEVHFFSGKQMLLILHFKSALSNPSVQQRLCARELGRDEK